MADNLEREINALVSSKDSQCKMKSFTPEHRGVYPKEAPYGEQATCPDTSGSGSSIASGRTDSRTSPVSPVAVLQEGEPIFEPVP